MHMSFLRDLDIALAFGMARAGAGASDGKLCRGSGKAKEWL